MELRQVGKTGLYLSQIGLGTLNWGRDTSPDDARDILELFLQENGTLVDTAPSFGEGLAETTVGKVVKELDARQELIICSKAGIGHFPGIGTRPDSSRGNLLTTLDASLRALETDYLDLWLVHNRDHLTPVEEVVSALEIAVTSGRVRYVGVSNFPAWAVGQLSALLGRSVAMAAVENEYSLLNRQIEAELVEACPALGLGVLAWSPLARGVLSGKYLATIPPDSRAASVHLAGFVSPYLQPAYQGIVQALVTAAAGLDRSAVDLALSWVLANPVVSSALVGPRTVQQLELIVGSQLTLPAQIKSALDDVSSELIYPVTDGCFHPGN